MLDDDAEVDHEDNHHQEPAEAAEVAEVQQVDQHAQLAEVSAQRLWRFGQFDLAASSMVEAQLALVPLERLQQGQNALLLEPERLC